MFLLSSSITCPYCFESIPEKKVLWRCSSYFCKKSENLENDITFKTYHPDESEKQPHICAPSKPKKGFVKCDKCHEDTRVQICPSCHSALPLTKENIIISIIGAPGAGKSYYVGTLINRLQTHLHKFGCSFSFTTTADEKQYRTKFADNFKKGLRLAKTQQPSDEANFVGANMPILVNVKDKKLDERTFTFFDAAGENFDDEAIMSAVAKYLNHSTAILLLLDPLQIPAVQSAVKAQDAKADVRENEKIISYDDILLNTVKVLRAQLRLGPKQKIGIPLAVAFSKWDMIQNNDQLRPDGSVIVKDSPHFLNGFSEADCDNVSIEVAGLLASWGYEGFLTTLDQNFSNYKFFGVSAIGAQPSASGSVPTIVSKRVEDPFLWLLHQRKIIV